MKNHYDRFNQIYDQYVDKIYRFIYLKVNSEDMAKDLTSEAFIKTWQSLTVGQEIQNPQAFIYRVARNLVIDYYRQKPHLPVSLSSCSEMSDPSSNIEKQFQFNSDIEKIKVVLANLKDEHREAVTLYYIDDLPVSEIAEILNKKEGTVRVLVHRGIKELKKQLGEFENV